RHPPRRHLPDPPVPLRRPRLLRPQSGRRQDEKGSPPSPQTPSQQRRLPSARHRRPASPPLAEAGPGGQTGATHSQRGRLRIPDGRLFGEVTPGPNKTLRQPTSRGIGQIPRVRERRPEPPLTQRGFVATGGPWPAS